jgi:DNA-binding winged helix-turn-helix (wHTH) protein
VNSGGTTEPLRFGSFAVDLQRRQVTRAGADVHLTPKAFDLLVLLVAEAPRVVSKSELHERLWPGTFVADATLVGVVKELRRGLADTDPDNPIIRTAHRVGYAFSSPILGRNSREARVSHWVVVQGRRVQLEPGENLIGRDPVAVVHLDSTGVSRRHARIVVEDAHVSIEDLGSKNGTSIGDTRLTGPARLRDGDRIHVGSVPLLYRTSASGISTETHIETHEGRSPR